jgi:uncharacterized glyoxalase superfamily protein PhnB
VDNAEQAVVFIKKPFGAVENCRLTMSHGKIAHCELKLGDSVLNLGESMEAGLRTVYSHRPTSKISMSCSIVRLTLAQRYVCHARQAKFYYFWSRCGRIRRLGLF